MIRLLQADADLKQAIVSGVVRNNSAISFKTAHDVPLAGLSDREVLAAAASENRILVSHDVTTMPNHFREFVRSQQSPGLILIPQTMAVGQAIDSLLLVAEAC